MAKVASNSLWRLIKAMTKSEKRYFKLFIHRNSGLGDNNYALMFDQIERQKVYDESKILEHFKGKALINSFPIVKRRVYESILRSLDSFHSESSVESELKRHLHYAEILFQKTLYDECGRILHSAKKMAIKYEKHLILLEVYKWEKKLIEKDSYVGTTEQDIQKMTQEDNLTLERIRNFSQYWNIKSRVFLLLNKKGKVRDSEDLIKFKTIIDTTLLKTPAHALSYETRYLFYHIYSAYYFGIGDYLNSYKNIQKHIELIEKNSEMFVEEPNKYFAVLTNMIYLCNQLKKFPEAKVYLSKLKSLAERISTGRNEDLEVKFFSSLASIELTQCVNTGEFEQGISLVPGIEAGLEKFEHKINTLREAYIYFYISVLYFAIGKHSVALRWIHKLLSEKKVEESQDIYCFAQIFNLIIHYELGNDDLLPYAIKSTQRYLQTRKRVYKFESIFLELISHITGNRTRKGIHGQMEKFHKEVEALKKDSFEKTVFEYFDFLSWAESNLKGIPFSEIIKEKVIKNG